MGWGWGGMWDVGCEMGGATAVLCPVETTGLQRPDLRRGGIPAPRERGRLEVGGLRRFGDNDRDNDRDNDGRAARDM